MELGDIQQLPFRLLLQLHAFSPRLDRNTLPTVDNLVGFSLTFLVFLPLLEAKQVLGYNRFLCKLLKYRVCMK
jgi:hypothetical protein